MFYIFHTLKSSHFLKLSQGVCTWFGLVEKFFRLQFSTTEHIAQHALLLLCSPTPQVRPFNPQNSAQKVQARRFSFFLPEFLFRPSHSSLKLTSSTVCLSSHATANVRAAPQDWCLIISPIIARKCRMKKWKEFIHKRKRIKRGGEKQLSFLHCGGKRKKTKIPGAVVISSGNLFCLCQKTRRAEKQNI